MQKNTVNDTFCKIGIKVSEKSHKSIMIILVDAINAFIKWQ